MSYTMPGKVLQVLLAARANPDAQTLARRWEPRLVSGFRI